VVGPGCAVAGACGGCPAWEGDHHAARAAKEAALRAAWTAAGLPPACVEGPLLEDLGPHGLRDRVDLALHEGALGLRALDGGPPVRALACPALSPSLEALRRALAADPPPLRRAGLRLRVGPVDPAGARPEGLWVDAANADLKALLDEGAWLRRQLAAGRTVELGQRRKEVQGGPGGLRLRPAALRPWWQTRLQGDVPADVFGVVGGFTQPGMAANARLLRQLRARAAALGAARWIELGAGAGNLTLPLLSLGAEVTAVEPDPLARAGLERGAAAAGLGAGLRLAPHGLDRPDAALVAALEASEAALVDPPRSGLGRLPEALAQARGPRALLYLSCHGPSLVADLARLAAQGWTPDRVGGVDWFPFTPHGEWLVGLRRG
jgi:23S rRNA (uracil1939-C5)-methyltransferase